MKGIDIPDENLVYVPECRKSTIRRLLEIGYNMHGKILFQDEFGTKSLMVAMKKNIKKENIRDIHVIQGKAVVSPISGFNIDAKSMFAEFSRFDGKYVRVTVEDLTKIMNDREKQEE